MSRTELQSQFGRVEELIHKLEKTTDPAARATAKELVQLLMEIHGTGLARMMDIAAESGAAGMDIIQRLGQDDLTRNLLLLYNLHPSDLDTRVAEALEKARPYLRSRDADVELIEIVDGAARVRLTGNAHGCTAETLKGAVEEALYSEAPDLTSLSIETEPHVAAPVFIPLAAIR
jgi:Fe-S cluster biogenesis protein NfuA